MITEKQFKDFIDHIEELQGKLREDDDDLFRIVLTQHLGKVTAGLVSTWFGDKEDDNVLLVITAAIKAGMYGLYLTGENAFIAFKEFTKDMIDEDDFRLSMSFMKAVADFGFGDYDSKKSPDDLSEKECAELMLAGIGRQLREHEETLSEAATKLIDNSMHFMESTKAEEKADA